jgi:hypothetical protein
MAGYYDYVLGAIPLALFGISGSLTFAGLSLTTAVPLAASVAVLLIGHALFVNAPVSSVSTNASANPRPLNAD